MSGRPSATTICLLATLAGAPLGGADRLELTTGDVFYGKVLRHSPREVSIRLDSGGVLSFRAQQVARLRLETPAGLYRTLLPQDFGRPPAAAEGPKGPPRPAEAAAPLSSAAPPHAAPPPAPRRLPPPAGEKPEAAGRLDIEAYSSSTGTEPVGDPRAGFSLRPPPGLTPEAADPAGGELLRFEDPLSHARFTASLYEREGSAAEFKDRIKETYGSRPGKERVVEEAEVTVAGRRGWILEVESELARAGVHQLQFFTRTARGILVLTYASPASHWPEYRVWVHRSITSLALSEPAGPPEETRESTPETEALRDLTREVEGALERGRLEAHEGGNAPGSPPPAEVEALLRGLGEEASRRP